MRRRSSCGGFWGRWDMSEWIDKPIRTLLSDSFAGEWGSPPQARSARVLRATDIDDDGHIRSDGAARSIAPGVVNAKRLLDGDLLLEASGGSTDRPVGRVAYFDRGADHTPYLTSNFFKTLRPAGEIAPRFLFWKLHWFHKQPPILSLQQQTTGIINLKFQDYLDTHLRVPEQKAEQSAIACILDTLDTQIEKTQALIAKLEQVKEGLLHDLLTRGVDENGELRPSAEEAPELYKASPLGLIPRNWSVGTVEDVVDSMTDGPFGSSLKTSHYVAEPGVRVVRLQNINRGWYDDNDKAYIRNVHAASLSRNLVHAGDLLVASLGDTNNPAGRACLYPADLPPAINKADCFRIRGLPNSASNAYLMLALNAGSASRQIRGNLQGVTLQRVNLRKLKSVVIPAPPLGEQSRICERFATVSDRKVQEAATLKEPLIN